MRPDVTFGRRVHTGNLAPDYIDSLPDWIYTNVPEAPGAVQGQIIGKIRSLSAF